MMRSTSFSVSVAATRSSRCSTTQPRASSGSKTASGGASLRRAASRNTSAAAIASTIPTTTKVTTQITMRHEPTRGTHPMGCDTGARSSDADALGEELAVVRGVTEQDLRALRTLEVQVRIVLPGEADAAVDLDVLGRGVEVRVRAVGLGERGHHRQLVVVLGRRPRRVVRRRLRRLDLEEHVGALVLDR